MFEMLNGHSPFEAEDHLATYQKIIDGTVAYPTGKHLFIYIYLTIYLYLYMHIYIYIYVKKGGLTCSPCI